MSLFSLFNTQSTTQEAEQYFLSQGLDEQEQQALQNNDQPTIEWECGWCMTIHAPGATTGICAACEEKFFKRR